jgi:aminoacrylate hydrolase
MGIVRAQDGCSLSVSVEGDGEALLLVPGLGGTASFWSDIAKSLRRTFRVIVLDHRGAGQSERPKQAYTVELLARDCADILDHFGVARAHVVGHSTGGAIAQVLALDYSGRVGRIVLSGSWAQPDARFRMLFETRLAILQAAGPQVYAAVSRLLALPPDRYDPGAMTSAIEGAARDLDPLDVAVERIRMVMNFDRLADIPRISARTLVIGAPDDMIVPFYHSEQLAAAIPGAVLRSMAGGHFFPRTDTDHFVRLVVEFLRAA